MNKPTETDDEFINRTADTITMESLMETYAACNGDPEKAKLIAACLKFIMGAHDKIFNSCNEYFEAILILAEGIRKCDKSVEERNENSGE